MRLEDRQMITDRSIELGGVDRNYLFGNWPEQNKLHRNLMYFLSKASISHVEERKSQDVG